METATTLQEHGSSDDILDSIPLKAQYGFKNVNVQITCMDAEKTHLLFGTNIGSAFLFNRELGSNIKLLSESRYDVVTSVKLLIGIECQAALGTEDGKLTIVVFSHSAASSARHVQKYSLGKIHRGAVTCMEWSSNGMKLFTGDKEGNVYVSDLDFEKNECNASLLLTEEYEIVQLCYKHQILLVSTSERSVLFHVNKTENNITPVGSKPARRGVYGGCFNADTISAADLKVFCTRPGYRLWIANINGKVTSTLQMKDLVSGFHPKIEVLETEKEKSQTKEPQFGRLLHFGENLVISYSDTAVFIIDPKNHGIIGSVQVWDDILSVAAKDDEIFVLRQNRQLHRISEKADETAVKRRLYLEERKKEAQANFQVPGSLLEMKKTFTPLVGALQSKMSSLNAEAEQWTQKFQTQAKVLQKKLPAVRTSLFTQKESEATSAAHHQPPSPTPSKSSQQSMKSEDDLNDNHTITQWGTSNTAVCKERRDQPQDGVQPKADRSADSEEIRNDCEPVQVVKTSTGCDGVNNSTHTPELCCDEAASSPKTQNGDQEFLHSQGDPNLAGGGQSSSMELHFEKLNKFVSIDDTDIVFNSKRKKRHRWGSRSSNNESSPDKSQQFVTNGEHLTSELHSSREEKSVETTTDFISDIPAIEELEISNADSDQHTPDKLDQKPDNSCKKLSDKDEQGNGLNHDAQQHSQPSSDPTSLLQEKHETHEQDDLLNNTADTVTTEECSSMVPSTHVGRDLFHGPCQTTNDDDDVAETEGKTRKSHLKIHPHGGNIKIEELGIAGGKTRDGIPHPNTHPHGGDIETEELVIAGGKTRDGIPHPNTHPHGGDIETEELVVAVHKTSGNQLFPEIIKSPVDQRKFKQGFNFPAKAQADAGLVLSTATDMQTKPECSKMDAGTSSSPKVPFSGFQSQSTSRAAEESNGRPSTVVHTASSKKQPEGGAKEYKPLFSDSDSDASDVLKEAPPRGLEDGHEISFSEDIYRVESGMLDFESEIDSDSDFEMTAQYRCEVMHSRELTSSSTSSSFQDFSSSSTSVPVRLLDNWSTTTTPHQVINISGSSNFIWYVDYYDHIYITEETMDSLSNMRWRKLAKKGIQLCISSSGDFAWLVSRRGKVYASVLPPELNLLEEPLKLEWQLVGTGVMKIALGADSAWAVSSTGGIKAQFGLSRLNPFTRGWDLVMWDKDKISQITLTKSTIWCRTEAGKLFAAEQMSIDSQDFGWEEVEPPVKKDNKPAVIQLITSDLGNILWAVDDHGSLWFLTEGRKWWQVNLSQYIDENHHLVSHSFMQSLPLPSKVSDSVHKVQRWMTGLVKVQHVAVNNLSVCVVYDKQKVHIARGPLTGSRWDVTTPLGVAKTTRWQNITTSSVFSPDQGTWIGLVWASQSSNEIFCFPSHDVAKTHPVTLTPPLDAKTSILCMSTCKEALWVLTDDGTIYIRSGISSECLQGTEWNELDTASQLGKVKIVHLSCGTQNVWAIDSTGQIYFRIGVTAVDRHSLPHAWIPIDGCPTAGCHFTQIECGLSDGSVWALDNFSNVYVRTEVSFTMPVGKNWESVPGSHAQQLCISNHTVWGLRMGGNVLRRYGISDRNFMGNYWKKIEGKFKKIAVTPYDELWAIDHDQRLRRQYTSIYCPLVVEAQYKIYPKECDWSTTGADQDWEIV